MGALNIRNPRAAELASRLAGYRKTTMTDAVIEALEAAVAREQENIPLGERLRTIVDEAQRLAGPNRRKMTKDDIDALFED
jgi:antitoxin VapB